MQRESHVPFILKDLSDTWEPSNSHSSPFGDKEIFRSLRHSFHSGSDPGNGLDADAPINIEPLAKSIFLWFDKLTTNRKTK